jgi:hypothetical protein
MSWPPAPTVHAACSAIAIASGLTQISLLLSVKVSSARASSMVPISCAIARAATGGTYLADELAVLPVAGYEQRFAVAAAATEAFVDLRMDGRTVVPNFCRVEQTLQRCQLKRRKRSVGGRVECPDHCHQLVALVGQHGRQARRDDVVASIVVAGCRTNRMGRSVQGTKAVRQISSALEYVRKQAASEHREPDNASVLDSTLHFIMSNTCELNLN